jgi:opacity protein-like surface antigen
MKTLKIAALAAAASLVATSALATAGEYYGRLDAGYAMSTPKAYYNKSEVFKSKANGLAGNVGIGYYYTDNVRMDVNFNFTVGSKKKITESYNSGFNGYKFKANTYTGLINGYYDFTGMQIVPYVTAGFGFQGVNAKISGTSDAGQTSSAKFKGKAAFAYQLGLGAAYEVTSGVMLDVGYRFTGNTFSKGKVDGNVYLKPGYTNTILVGARMSF